MYQPFIFKLESGNSDILDKKSKSDNLILSSTINLPLNSLGFHTFLHRTKSAMSITNTLQTKTKFYYVINPFEPEIANYEDSLINLTKQYLSIKDDSPDITNRGFYKMWEMIYLFNLCPEKELTCAAISDSNGTFIQAIISFRDKLGQGTSKDKFFGVSINPDKSKYVEMTKQFLGYYNKQVPGLIKVHKNKKEDISQIKTIGLFKKDIEKNKAYANLVIADGEFEWDDENFKEQDGYQLILGEIIAGLRVQAKSGNFVLKIFETFTFPSIKLIYLLSSFYEETYVHKPFFSRNTNSEKYIICKNFKYDQKKDSAELDTKIKSLEKVLEGMESLQFVFDIYPDLVLPQNFIDVIKFINIKIANPQQIMINEIIKYIKDNNYFGDKYHMFREKQIEATKWWVNNFYPPSNNLYEKNKDDLQKILKSSQEKYEMEETKFISTLIK